jgi:ABC-type sugar transport system substrate-binding protein
MYRIWTVALAAGLALSVAACGSANDDDAGSGTTATVQAATTTVAQDGKGLSIGSSALWNANATVKLANDAWTAGVRARGATPHLLQADAKDPVNTLISNLDQLTAEKVDSAAFYPIDPNALTAPVRRAVAAGIPVFSYETTKAPITGAIHTSRESAASMIAEALCQKFPDGAKVVYGAYAQPDPTLNAYRAAFTNDLKQCSGGKSTVAAVFENKTDDVAGAIEPALAALQRVPDAKAIVAYSDVTAIGASRAASQLGSRKNLEIFGYNLAPDGLEALRKGVIDYSVQYPVALEAQYLADKQVDAALGRKVPKYTTFWGGCYSTATVDQLPSPAEQLKAIAAGRSLLVDPDAQRTTSETAFPTTPPAGGKGCPTD